MKHIIAATIFASFLPLYHDSLGYARLVEAVYNGQAKVVWLTVKDTNDFHFTDKGNTLKFQDSTWNKLSDTTNYFK